MTDQPKTGSVTSRTGKITARNIVTGVDIQGAADDKVLNTALEVMQTLHTGDVQAAEGVEASGDIITGLRYLNPQTPTAADFMAELKALRRELAEAAAAPDTPAEAGEAVESLDQAITEAQKEKPSGKRVVNRLREALDFISDAGKALDAADKAGPLVLKAVGLLTTLYQVAQTLF